MSGATRTESGRVGTCLPKQATLYHVKKVLYGVTGCGSLMNVFSKPDRGFWVPFLAQHDTSAEKIGVISPPLVRSLACRLTPIALDFCFLFIIFTGKLVQFTKNTACSYAL